jgi:hypothetical protein
MAWVVSAGRKMKGDGVVGRGAVAEGRKGAPPGAELLLPTLSH